MKRTWILPIIVLSQFCCTSLWFAGNAVMDDLIFFFDLDLAALGHLTSAVQLGFIVGTLVFAFFTIADQFSPSKVFFFSAIIGALFNLGTLLEGNTMVSLVTFRFLTGFFLAGIYPVGMKISADYFDKGLGKSLGYLVGALVLGTAFPHLLKGFTEDFPWRTVILYTSLLAILGGMLMLLLVPDGPYRKASQKPDFKVFYKVFAKDDFRSAAIGYFGHMWELYAFWTFVPVILTTYVLQHPEVQFNISLLTSIIIGLGGLACVAGGYLSMLYGTKRSAATALFLSGCCCLISPLIFYQSSPAVLLGFLIFWGLVVIADSPLFSTLVAKSADAGSKGTALTIVNCIGFSITILSVQLINYGIQFIDSAMIYMVLAFGPAIGLFGLLINRKNPEIA